MDLHFIYNNNTYEGDTTIKTWGALHACVFVC